MKIYTITILLLLLSFVPFGYSEPNKIIYELQEKCGKICNEMFQKEYGKSGVKSDKTGTMMSNYSNHYNTKLNRCFILLTTTSIPKGKENNPLVMKNLFDINENKEFGYLYKSHNNAVPLGCNVGNKPCKSEAEFEAMIKPYMEE
jgi:5'-3' exonuclease